MRKILMFVTVTLLMLQAAGADDFRSLIRRSGSSVPGAPWATLARSAEKDAVSANALSLTTTGLENRPIVLLETNYYTFLPADRLQLRVTTSSNGYALG